jgi:stage II sporulation protein M
MKKKNFLKENYKKCWEFAIESRWFFVGALSIFAATFLIGFAYPAFFRAEIFKIIEELALSVQGKTTSELITFIFFNNLKASFMAMALGIFFAIFPIITAIINGYLIGFVSREVVAIEGISAMWRLAPHGIFELPAVIFAIGIGIKIGLSIISPSDTNKTTRKKLKHNFIEALRFFISVILPLLIIAAIIEGILIGLSV